MKKHARLIAAICVSFIGHGCAIAADLPRSDPDRAAILQDVRPEPHAKFVVKDLRKLGDFAFLCALVQTSDGAISRTDDAINVYKWTFVRNADRRYSIELHSGFARDVQHVSCDVERGDGLPPQKIESEQDIVSVTLDAVKDQIRGILDHRYLSDANGPVLRALESKKVLGEIPIEHEKEPLNPYQLQFAKESCSSNNCVGAVEKAFHLLSKARTDNTVSSLVWTGCQYGMGGLELMAIQRCVSTVSRLPYCRPHMKLNADRKDIARCVVDIQAARDQDAPRLPN